MKRTTLIAVIAGGLVLILLWYFVLFSPTSSDLNDTRDEVAAVQSQNQELENTIRRLKELSRNAPQQEATLRTLRAAIPANPDLGEFILQANDIASAAGIDWLSIAPTPPAASTTGGPQSTIALSMQIDGGFFEVLDYLNRLEDLERLVLVDSINVSVGASDTGGTTGGVTDSTGGAPDLSVTLTGRMFTGAPPTAADGSVITPTPTTPGGSTGSTGTTGTTVPGGTTGSTTPPASSSGASS
jgi:Tfp pilus assembly protein PilO